MVLNTAMSSSPSSIKGSLSHQLAFNHLLRALMKGKPATRFGTGKRELCLKPVQGQRHTPDGLENRQLSQFKLDHYPSSRRIDLSTHAAHTCPMSAVTPANGTYRYRFLVDDRVVCHGITTDLCRRQREHQRRWPGGHIEQVGDPTSHCEAWDWKQEQSADKSALTG